VGFLLAIEQISNFFRGFYSFLHVCEGSLAHAGKPCENYHCLDNDVMVSGFWLRNEMDCAADTSKTEAFGIMKERGAGPQEQEP